MNKSWNYHLKVGGAESLGSAGGTALRPKGWKAECKAGRHKWMTRRWTRKCLRCDIEQAKDALGKFS